MNFNFCYNLIILLPFGVFAQSYAPAAGVAGSTAIHKNSPLFVQWASGITVSRGFINISNPSATYGGTNYASFGLDSDALGFPSGAVVSLGDAGSAVLTFDNPIVNGEGFDFAIFENGSSNYLELAFVEVSSEGINFFRFPNHSQTQTEIQLTTFESPEPTFINNLAGKYTSEYGTPFDISELADHDFLDKNNIQYVKIIDMVGSINPDFASYDSFGNKVNESFPTPFNAGGFDLQGVGVISSTLDVGGFRQNTKCTIYPNPTNDQFSISNAEEAAVSIYNLNGVVVYSTSMYQNQNIFVGHLPSGIYLVKIFLNSEIKNLKLIKQ